MVAFGWTMYASTRFLGQTQHPNRRLLVLYPIFLFYFVSSFSKIYSFVSLGSKCTQESIDLSKRGHHTSIITVTLV